MKNKGDSNLSEKEKLLFNLLTSKYETDQVDLKYLTRLRTRMLHNETLTESELADMYSLEQTLSSNVEDEINAMQA